MPAFFLALLLCFTVTLAGRDTVRVARLAAAMGPGAGHFAAIWISVAATSVLAAWLGRALAGSLDAGGKQMFVALVLGLTAVELALLKPRAAPREPTRSLGAITLVQLASQLTAAAPMITGTMVLATGDMWLAGTGGALGTGAALSLGVLAGADWEQRVPVRLLALSLSLLLLLAAFVMALLARGIIG